MKLVLIPFLPFVLGHLPLADFLGAHASGISGHYYIDALVKTRSRPKRAAKRNSSGIQPGPEAVGNNRAR